MFVEALVIKQKDNKSIKNLENLPYRRIITGVLYTVERANQTERSDLGQLFF